MNGIGNSLDNYIVGNAAGNLLDGKDGNDILTGINPSNLNLGQGTIDKLTGGAGNDTFILGNTSGIYYNDGNTTSAGRNDYAWITDFSAGDKIQLNGSSPNYFLRNENLNGVTGFCLYRNDGTGIDSLSTAWDNKDELIGFIQVSGVTLNLSSTDQFTYIA